MKTSNSDTINLRNQHAMPEEKFLLLSIKSNMGYKAIVISQLCQEQVWCTQRLQWVAPH